MTFPASAPLSGLAAFFQAQFSPIVEINYQLNGRQPIPQGSGLWWDPAGYDPSPTKYTSSTRRAFFCRPLIASSGPDQRLGIGQIGFDYNNYGVAGLTPLKFTNPDKLDYYARVLNLIEGTASPLSPDRDFGTAPYYGPSDATAAITDGMTDLTEGWQLDDITNQYLQVSGGGTQ